MPKFAILRTSKLCTVGSIASSGSHNFRQRPTPNSDQSLTPKNRHFGAKSKEELLAVIAARTPAKVRKNAVRCIEYLITASPEAMAQMKPSQQNQYFRDSVDWLKQRHGEANVVAGSIHRDETTPHLVVYVVPEFEGKLNARKFLGGRKTLSDMQTDFVKKVGSKHGLERGVERSGANHKEVKQWYAEQRAAGAAVPDFKPSKVPFTDSIIVPEPEFAKLVALARVSADQRELIRRAEAKAKADEKAKKQAEKRAKQAEAALHHKQNDVSSIKEELISQSTKKLDLLKSETDLKLNQLSHDKQELIKITADMLKAQPKDELAKLLGIPISKGDIFDQMIKHGLASTFPTAVVRLAKAYNEANSTRISEAANWVADYNSVDKPKSSGPKL